MPSVPTFALTPQLVAAHAGSRVICLAGEGLGRRFALYNERPGPALNLRAHREGGRIEWRADARARDEERERRADLPSGSAHVVRPVEASPALIRVDLVGPLEQRAGYEGECGAWLDGHDAVADRLCAAFAEGDVLFVVDSPGGAAAEIPANVRRALEAKAAYGRRCTGFGKPMVGSAAMWWATALCDELFGESDSQFGSIGARGEHVDISGMMAKEGVKKTYFADPPDKIAWAPEFPLGPVGEARGNRDVKLAADAFRAAVCASPLGQDMGLTPEYLIELGADMLTGEYAAAAGLVHAVDTFENVTARALQLAENPAAKEIENEARATARAGAARAKGDRAMPKIRTEGDEGEAGREIPTKCKTCGVENEEDAKFCKGCGESMATEGPPSEPEPAPKSSERPGEKKTEERKEDEKNGAHPPPPERMTAPHKMSPTASEAAILRATSDTPVARKTAAIDLRHVFDTAAGITGKSEPREIVDALLAMPHLLARGDAARRTLREQTAATETKEHRRLCMRYVELNPGMRSKVLADIDGKGNPYVDGKGNRLPRIRTAYLNMSVGTLGTIVGDLEKDAPPPRAPWEPDRQRAETAAAAASGAAPPTFTDAQKKRLEQHPDVLTLRSKGSALTVEQLVAGVIATNPQSAARFLAGQNGAAP